MTTACTEAIHYHAIRRAPTQTPTERVRSTTAPGNLTAQTVIAGSAPSYSVTVDPATNHIGTEDARAETMDSPIVNTVTPTKVGLMQ